LKGSKIAVLANRFYITAIPCTATLLCLMQIVLRRLRMQDMTAHSLTLLAFCADSLPCSQQGKGHPVCPSAILLFLNTGFINHLFAQHGQKLKFLASHNGLNEYIQCSEI
jgi:hypothetical protein